MEFYRIIYNNDSAEKMKTIVKGYAQRNGGRSGPGLKGEWL